MNKEMLDAMIDESDKPEAFKEFCVLLLDNPDETAEFYQTNVFQIAKKNDIKPGVWFKMLYQIIWQQERGPKMGHFIYCVGALNIMEAVFDNLLEELMRGT